MSKEQGNVNKLRENEEDHLLAPTARLHLLFLTQRRKGAKDAKEEKRVVVCKLCLIKSRHAY
jgi:hypothetical protein